MKFILVNDELVNLELIANIYKDCDYSSDFYRYKVKFATNGRTGSAAKSFKEEKDRDRCFDFLVDQLAHPLDQQQEKE